jgi:hypothetical protein
MARNSAHIRAFLDVSAVHLDAASLLHVRASLGANNSATEYGWWLFVPTEDDERTPEVLRAIFAAARERECAYLLIDADAEPMAGLPTFDPEAVAATADEWATEQALADAEASLDQLETAYLDGEITRQQWANGGA